MPSQTETVTIKRANVWLKRAPLLLGAAVLISAMVLDTTVVQIGSEADVREVVFDPDAFGVENFPTVQANVIDRALDALELAKEIEADKAGAAEKFGVAAVVGHVMPVKFTALAGENKSGNYELSIEGLPDTIRVRMQTGPALNGTDLRDATGDIEFGAFKNQIEFQDAGSGLNRAMKKEVLDPIDTTNLSGKQLEVVGVFKLLNPKNWFVTPVRLEVK